MKQMTLAGSGMAGGMDRRSLRLRADAGQCIPGLSSSPAKGYSGRISAFALMTMAWRYD